MRTLYISDLDGTLLNSEAKLSNRTTSIINQLIENGLLFTIVTARSYKSAFERIDSLDLNIPIGFSFNFEHVQSCSINIKYREVMFK